MARMAKIDIKIDAVDGLDAPSVGSVVATVEGVVFSVDPVETVVFLVVGVFYKDLKNN